jgi:hypothetical protein
MAERQRDISYIPANLSHEARNDTMELAVLVAQSLAELPRTLLARAKSAEVLRRSATR